MSVIDVAPMSALVFAVPSQFVALDLWVPGNLPVISIVIAIVIRNLFATMVGGVAAVLCRPFPMVR